MFQDLNISPEEKALIFIDDDLTIQTQDLQLTDSEVFSICKPFIDGNNVPTTELHQEEFNIYTRKVKSMVSSLNLPVWMRSSPADEVKNLLQAGSKAILLYGPPRTGKTRLIDEFFKRESEDRSTIQIHEGWQYDHLVEGFKPDNDGKWGWEKGPLKKAIDEGKKCIVLEEINRTAISQALGEVFSLIEETYRGEPNSIMLRSGEKFWIPEDVVFLMTMNTVDKSTEDIDDALLGRVAAVEFPPRPEDLNHMLSSNGVPTQTAEKLTLLFAEILNIYPLGHGYFAGLQGATEDKHVITYYKARVRPVLSNFLGELKKQELARIDNIIDEMFGRA